jgi:peroxiredoxin
LDLSSLRGHRAVLAFVQAGCGSCAADLRNLGALAPAMRDARFVALNLPGGGSARELQDFAVSLGVHGGITYLADPDGRIAQRYGITAIDTVIVIDRNGQIRARLQSPGRSALRHALAAVPG